MDTITLNLYISKKDDKSLNLSKSFESDLSVKRIDTESVYLLRYMLYNVEL